MTGKPVVCNASPLIALQQVGQLPSLETIFGAVVIPPAVALEVAPSVELPDWIKTQRLSQPRAQKVLLAALGPGESEAICLALETGASRILLDDRPARRLAQASGLVVTGTLGILLACKRKGLLPAVKPALESLLRFGFRVAPDLHDLVLRDAGESE